VVVAKAQPASRDMLDAERRHPGKTPRFIQKLYAAYSFDHFFCAQSLVIRKMFGLYPIHRRTKILLQSHFQTIDSVFSIYGGQIEKIHHNHCRRRELGVRFRYRERAGGGKRTWSRAIGKRRQQR
jgi:hypothetical protein